MLEIDNRCEKFRALALIAAASIILSSFGESVFSLSLVKYETYFSSSGQATQCQCKGSKIATF